MAIEETMNVGAMLANVVNLQDRKIKTTPLRSVGTIKVSKGVKNYAVIPWRAALDKRINKTAAYLVLTIICGYTNRTGETWVGQQTIADILGVTKQAVQKQVARLVQLGYIQILSKAYKERSARMRVVFDPSLTMEDVKAAIPARLQENNTTEQQPLPKEQAAIRLKALKEKFSRQPQKLSQEPVSGQPQELSQDDSPDNQNTFLRQPNEGLGTTSGSCQRVVEGNIRKGVWLEE